jgi:hypothetical protein
VLFKFVFYVRRVLVFSLLLISITCGVNAQAVNFHLSKYVVASGEEIILYADSLPKNVVKIKPFAGKAAVYIFNKKTGKWFSSGGSWLDMPMLEPEIKLKIISDDFGLENIKFQLLDNTGKVYETDSLPVYSSKFFESYINTLNTNISSAAKINTDVLQTSASVNNEEQTKNVTATPSKDLKSKLVSYGLLGVVLTALFSYFYLTEKAEGG